MFTRPDNWSKMSPVERQRARLDHWEKAEGLKFHDAAAEAAYRARANRLRKCLDMAGPDRPVADIRGAGENILRRKGMNGRDILYGHERAYDAVIEFHRDFQPDLATIPSLYPGDVFDTLDFRTYVWGGRQLADEYVIQAVENEYMVAEQYAVFAEDPSGFWLKSYLPRMFGALGPMALLPDWPLVSEIVDVGGAILPFGRPEVQAMLKTLMAAGDQAAKWAAVRGKIGGELAAMGFPPMSAATLKAPFDYLGDTLRGTKGILMDMYRRPNDVTKACEAYVPVLVRAITAACDRTGAPLAWYPLHKGADAFMSQKQFDKFYWPTFKAVMLGLYEEGITNFAFVEGTYNNRLEAISEMPERSVLWHFDKTDMAKAKQVLGDKFTLMGNVPPSLMTTGSFDEMRAYCDRLVDLFSDSRGFILAFGCGFEGTADEKVRAYMDSVKR